MDNKYLNQIYLKHLILIVLHLMTTLLTFFQNPNLYKKLPLPIATILSLGFLGYCIRRQTNTGLCLNMLGPLQKLLFNINDKLIKDTKVKFSKDKFSKDDEDDEGLKKLSIPSTLPFHDEILQYMYHMYGDQIDEFNYTSEKVYHFNEWKYRRKDKPLDLKIMRPCSCKIEVLYKDEPITIEFKTLKDNNNNFMKLLVSGECAPYEEIISILELTGENKDILTNFADDAKEWTDEQKKKIKSCSKETMNIYYYKKDYWTLLSKSPKRLLSTVYLKEGEQESLIESVDKFFSKDTRDIYLSFGIPYKSVNLIHGPPGTGKTSIIKAIASSVDCDLYILPISKDMLDTNLVDAFTHINGEDGKERIIVIEDIDTIFDSDRKEGDDKNGITLQAFLNCLDGFTCVEGTMLFLTANKPEVLDYAMIRSCRIDYKMKLDYADEYQTKKMFLTFLPDQEDKFKDFYNLIKHKEYTTAMLQEFLFYNRDCEDILLLERDFIDIVEKNDPKNFEILKEENKNFYS